MAVAQAATEQVQDEEQQPVTQPEQPDTNAPVLTTVREVEQKDVTKKQEASAAAPDFDSWVNNIRTTGTPGRIGDTVITKEILDASSEEDMLNLRFNYKFMTPSQDTPAIPMLTPAGQLDVEALKQVQTENPDLFPQTYRNANARKAIRRELIEAGMDTDAVEIFTNGVILGSGTYEVAQRLSEAGRFAAVSVPDFITNTLPATAYSMYKSGSLLPIGPKFRAEFEAASQQFREDYISWRDGAKSVFSDATMADYFNDGMHTVLERMDRQKKDYEAAGQPLPPSLQNFDYDALAYMKDSKGDNVLDEDGQPIKRTFVNEQMAYNIADITFGSLDKWTQAGVIIGEEGFYGVLSGGSAYATASARMKKIMDYKKSPKYAKMLKDVDNPYMIMEIVTEFEGAQKADKFLQMGLAQYRLSTQLKETNSRISEIRAELYTLNKSGKKDSDLVDAPTTRRTDAQLEEDEAAGVSKQITVKKYRDSLLGELRQLRSTRNRAFLTGRVVPYAKDVTESSLAIGIGTALGREYGLFGIGFEDPNMNEAVANVAMSIGGYRFIQYGGKLAATRTISGVSTAARNVLPFGEQMRAMVASIPGVGPIVVDTTLENIEKIMGRSLVGDERVAMINTVTMYKNMDPQLRQQSLEYMREGSERMERFIARFPPEKRAKMRELVSKTFDGSAGILSLVAAGELRRGQIDISTLSRYDLVQMEDDLRNMESSFRVTEMALAEIIEFAGDIDDDITRELTAQFVETKRRGLAKLKTDLQTVNRQRLDALDDLEKHLINLSGDGMSPETLKALTNYRGALHESLGSLRNDAEAIKKQNDTINASIDSSLSQARAMRGKPGYKAYVNKALETLLSGADSRVRLLGTRIYAPVSKVLQGSDTQLDLLPLVIDLVEGGDVRGLDRYFGTSSEVFIGRDGAAARAAFTDVLHETLSETEMGEIRDQLIQGASGNTARIDYLKNADDLTIAIEMIQYKRQQGDDTFNPFRSQNAYSLELIRRAFARTAHGYSQSGDRETAAVFKKFVDGIDNIYAQNPEVARAIEKARNEYTAHVGVPRSEGMYLDDWYNSINRPVPATAYGGGMGGIELQKMYFEDKDPINLFNDLVDEIASSLMPGARVNEEKLRMLSQKVMRSFGTLVDGEYVFDLTTEQGRIQYKQFSMAMQELVYDKLGGDFLQKHQKVRGKRDPLAKIRGEVSEDFLEQIEGSLNGLNVGFITEEGGSVVREPMMDLFEAVQAHNSFVHALENIPAMRDSFNKLKADFKEYKSKSRAKIDRARELEEMSIDLVEQSLGDFTAADFFDKFILSGEGGSLDTLERAFMRGAKAKGLNKAEAKEMFRKMTLTYTLKGLYDKAGLTAISGATVTKDVSRKVDSEFATPEQLLLELEKEGVQTTLIRILGAGDDAVGQDHLDFLTETMQMLNDSTYAISARGATGDFAKPGYSSQLSRVWNLAKGVVSPVYVASEYMFVAAKAGQINLFKLTLENKEAAAIIHKMVSNPDLMSTTDFNKLEAIATNYLFSEFGANYNEFVLADDNGEIIMHTGAMMDGVEDATLRTYNYVLGGEEEDDEDETPAFPDESDAS